MLNSVEREILNADKYKNIKRICVLGSDKPRMLFFPAHKCYNANNFGILTVVTRKSFMLK